MYDTKNFASDVAEAMKPQSWPELAEFVRATARRCRWDAERLYGRRSYLRPREAEVIGFNSAGRTNSDPSFSKVSKITGKWLRSQVEWLKKNDAQATGASIDGGLDLFETFRDMLDGGDYEPCVEVWEVEVPKALWDSI